jgi:hypothetical protein
LEGNSYKNRRNIYAGIYSIGYYESIFIKYRITGSFDGKIFFGKVWIFLQNRRENGGKIIEKIKNPRSKSEVFKISP